MSVKASEEPSLQALENTLLATIQTLDRLDEFALPSEQPDNQGLAVNLCVDPPARACGDSHSTATSPSSQCLLTCRVLCPQAHPG